MMILLVWADGVKPLGESGKGLGGIAAQKRRNTLSVCSNDATVPLLPLAHYFQ